MCDEFEKTIQLIGEFSKRYLDDEFRLLCIKLAYKLEETEGISFADDKPEHWACGIIYAIGQLNFLFDTHLEPYVTQDRLCYHFSANRQRMSAKSRDIRRLLNLKLGNEEFSTEFVLSLRIPESDADLKRIRQMDEIKYLVSKKRPKDVESVDNADLERMIDGFFDNPDWDELFFILRSTYFIRPFSGYMGLILKETVKFRVPLYTSVEKCCIPEDSFEDFRLGVWPFSNIISELKNEDLDGVVINDSFVITKDMIRSVYPNPDDIDYHDIFFAVKIP